MVPVKTRGANLRKEERNKWGFVESKRKGETVYAGIPCKRNSDISLSLYRWLMKGLPYTAFAGVRLIFPPLYGDHRRKVTRS